MYGAPVAFGLVVVGRRCSFFVPMYPGLILDYLYLLLLPIQAADLRPGFWLLDLLLHSAGVSTGCLTGDGCALVVAGSLVAAIRLPNAVLLTTN